MTAIENDGLVSLRSECPFCRKRESRRVAVWRLRLYADADPERVVETIVCKCGKEYTVAAKAYQNTAADFGSKDPAA